MVIQMLLVVCLTLLIELKECDFRDVMICSLDLFDNSNIIYKSASKENKYKMSPKHLKGRMITSTEKQNNLNCHNEEESKSYFHKLPKRLNESEKTYFFHIEESKGVNKLLNNKIQFVDRKIRELKRNKLKSKHKTKVKNVNQTIPIVIMSPTNKSTLNKNIPQLMKRRREYHNQIQVVDKKLFIIQNFLKNCYLIKRPAPGIQKPHCIPIKSTGCSKNQICSINNSSFIKRTKYGRHSGYNEEYEKYYDSYNLDVEETENEEDKLNCTEFVTKIIPCNTTDADDYVYDESYYQQFPHRYRKGLASNLLISKNVLIFIIFVLLNNS